MWIILLSAFMIALICVKIIKTMWYWKSRGVPYIKPWPILGNTAPLTLKKRAFPNLIQDLYDTHPEKRYVGFHQFSTPVLMFRDPDLIKQICIKDFDSFADRQQFLPKEADPFWDRNLLALSGDKWKIMRATLSPAFTSSKMQAIFGLLQESARQFTDHLLKKDGLVILEMKDIFTRFTNDVTASTIFGVTCDSLETGDNVFYQTVKQASNFGGGIKGLKLYGYTFCPKLMKLLNITFFEEEVKDFFLGIVTETMRYREKHSVIRPDMIHLLMEAKKGQLNDPKNKQKLRFEETNTEITDDDITAQALIFFLGGFDTSSTLMCFITYELALNSDIQTKLIQEIDRILKIEAGEVTYNTLISMQYLNMVVNETLRKCPPSALISRVATKHFTIETHQPNELPVILEPGTVCWIPVYAIHRDHKYYPNPDRFDPERFSEQNKSKTNPFAFLPFGLGPRNCIGIRFALLKVKTLIFQLLSKFEIVPVDKTEIPLTFSKTGMNMMSSNGVWLGLKGRKTRNNLL